MLVSPSQNSSIPALLTGTTPGDTAPSTTAAPSRPAAATTTNAAAPAPANSDTVTLSPAHDRPDHAAAAPIYAEVWKDGLKIAAIDNHGSVISYAGPLAAAAGGAAGGPWIAAIRAAQVAQSVGGEIRINGLTLDAGTLRTRAQLETAYGR